MIKIKENCLLFHGYSLVVKYSRQPLILLWLVLSLKLVHLVAELLIHQFEQ